MPPPRVTQALTARIVMWMLSTGLGAALASVGWWLS
jgi:hypothetical protein